MSNIFEDREKAHQDEPRKLMAPIKEIREVAITDERGYNFIHILPA
jgi:hypothetical protein